MKREEWYNSPEFKKLRMFNNMTHEVGHLVQRLYDMLHILEGDFGPLIGDKFSLYERQLRIVSVEASNLVRYETDMHLMLERMIKSKLGVKDE
jgi:hypothetical protein